MPQYNAPIRDYEFILNELINLDNHKDIAGYDQLDSGLVGSLMSEVAKLCEQVLFPLNQIGDKEGLKFENGKVTMPSGFRDAYKNYVSAGWGSLTCDPKYGGQGLPEIINMPLIEMVCSANLSFGLTPGLSHGAYNAIYTHASDEIKDRFLPKIVSGEWTGVMCLTEPQCGTDLGLITTKALPSNDGTYKITGTKIFISSGEHDLTENIIHLVLARLPDAPEGVKGISLFVVPKFLVNDDGSLGDFNNVTCGSIEHKMGISASPTCVINYDGATGYLVGQANNGLKAMFTMMNEARLYVGVQGLGLAAVSYQNAAQYAKDRLQGRSINGAKYPNKKADPLIVHPDIRRMLLTMRSFVEGARALAIFTSLQIDISKRHNDATARQEADDFVQFITPILKAYFTDMGFLTTNLGVQIYGGYGYIKEYGMEQYVRDARIAQIYEGANGIQALDLVGRKMTKNTGRYLRSFFHPAHEFIEKYKNDSQMAEFTKALYKALGSAQQASLWIAANGLANKEEAAAAATEYLELLAITIIGYFWARMAQISLTKLNDSANNEKEFYQAKLDTARFYINKILPNHYGLLSIITTGCSSVMKMQEEAF